MFLQLGYIQLIFWDFTLEQIYVHRASQSCEISILPHMLISFHKQG